MREDRVEILSTLVCRDPNFGKSIPERRREIAFTEIATGIHCGENAERGVCVENLKDGGALFGERQRT